MENLNQHESSAVLSITDEIRVAEVRRILQAQAVQLGFDETVSGRIAIVVTELSTNLVRHGGGGVLIWRVLGQGQGLEMLAIDHGGGMENVQECLRDGFSTNGTAGNGLGAISRLADVFDLYSLPGKGTVVLAQIYAKKQTTREAFISGAICIPISGETHCGDCWRVLIAGDHVRAIIADGLGHGDLAAEAAQGAVTCAERTPNLDQINLLKVMHGAIAASRGAAVGVCDISQSGAQANFCGVGNIASVLVIPLQNQRNMVSQNGIVGHQIRKLQQYSYPWSTNALLIMHSDGLLTRWSLDEYPGLVSRHPAVIAAVMYRDFTRGRDDLTVVVVKENP